MTTESGSGRGSNGHDRCCGSGAEGRGEHGREGGGGLGRIERIGGRHHPALRPGRRHGGDAGPGPTASRRGRRRVRPVGRPDRHRRRGPRQRAGRLRRGRRALREAQRARQPRRRLPALRGRAPRRRGHHPPDGDELLRSRLRVARRRAAAPGRRGRRHRQHLERVDAAPVPDAVDVRRLQGGARGIRQGAGPGGARRRHPGDDGRAGHRGRRRWRRHGLRVGPRATPPPPMPSGRSGDSSTRCWVATADRASTTSATCTSSS